MLYIYNSSTNPYFNLAAEEYILTKFKDNCFMLWRNESCVVIGKNQNALSEINLEYVKENHIPVVRRLSGGGAVFHDLGNLNFTFISNDDIQNFSNFKKFTLPIIDVLKKLNINAEFSGRNDLTIDGQKFSGNAQYNYKNRILHHGTLLFSSNITDISAALNAKPIKFQDKSVKSVASRVTNISKHLCKSLNIMEFKDLIMDHIKDNYADGNIYDFTKEDISNIKKLMEEKYSTWEWNYGSSPKYSFTNLKRFSCGIVEFNLDIEKGVIKNAKIYGDFFSKKSVKELEDMLIGIKHEASSIKEAIMNCNLDDYISNISVEEFIEGLMY